MKIMKQRIVVCLVLLVLVFAMIPMGGCRESLQDSTEPSTEPSAETEPTTNLIYEENGESFIVLPLSHKKLSVRWRYLSHLSALTDSIILDTEQRLAKRMEEYPDAEFIEYGLTLDAADFLCLTVKFSIIDYGDGCGAEGIMGMSERFITEES